MSEILAHFEIRETAKGGIIYKEQDINLGLIGAVNSLFQTSFTKLFPNWAYIFYFFFFLFIFLFLFWKLPLPWLLFVSGFNLLLCISYHTVLSIIWQMFSEFHIFWKSNVIIFISTKSKTLRLRIQSDQYCIFLNQSDCRYFVRQWVKNRCALR